MTELVSLVVGAGGPLGRAVVNKLVALGYRVAGADRNTAGLDLLPSGVTRIPGDATDPGEAKLIVETAISEIGVPSALVNTIGAHGMGDALSTTQDQLRDKMDVNLGPS